MKQAYIGFLCGIVVMAVSSIIVVGTAKHYDTVRMEKRAVEVGVACKDHQGRIVWINPNFYYVLTGESADTLTSLASPSSASSQVSPVLSQ